MGLSSNSAVELYCVDFCKTRQSKSRKFAVADIPQ